MAGNQSSFCALQRPPWGWEMGTRTWLFGEGRMDPNVVEMNLRRGQLIKDREDEIL
jgi:hypothetical protein